jgi:hypothetical protein
MTEKEVVPAVGIVPWESAYLDDWYIVAANHYIRYDKGGDTVRKEKHFYCAMTKNGIMIEARGPDPVDVFTSLERKADRWRREWERNL